MRAFFEWVVRLLFSLLFACALLWAQDDEPRISSLNHEPPLAKSLSRRIVVLNLGRKLAEGRPDEAVHNAVVEAYLVFPDIVDKRTRTDSWRLVPETASRPVAVCTTEELENLVALARQQDRPNMDALVTVDYLAYEDTALHQYVKFTFETAVFIQSKARKNGKGLDEIDHWIVTVGLDGHLVSASHDQIVEDNAIVVSMKDLPAGDKEAVSVAQGVIDRFLGLPFKPRGQVGQGTAIRD